ncbi:MAG: drug/metabolite transporter (DMT)-like permease [Salibacteraceae bacterium]|jgi:drug/metabolite transporter (DMT)-like permease
MRQKLEDNPNFTGYLFAILATAIWSGNFVIARGLSDDISPISLAFWRWVIATVVLLPMAIKPLIKQRKEIRKHLPYLCITGLLGVTIFNTMLYYAGKTTTAINLSLLSITFPIFIILISRVVFKEAIGWKKTLGIAIVAFGVIFMITKGHLSTLLGLTFQVGDLWMIGGAFVFAVYSILLRKKPADLNIWSFQLSTFLLGLLFLSPIYVWDYFKTPDVLYTTTTYLSIGYVGVFASLAAFVLWNKSILNIGPSEAGMVYYTLPIFSGALAYFILDEPIGWLHITSAGLIFSGILIANTKPK